MTFGEKLQEDRKKAGFTQEQFAEILSVSRSAVAKWETDKGVPDIENLKTMAKLLDVSIDYLLEENGGLDLTVIREPINLQDYGHLNATKCEAITNKQRVMA
ncbi:MAG: helix-turn-helix transcriptional regulator [Oscillospiraceae bacterium]|nr:helix-turn-helix transcriptional regulator [Oscillospiraceae bacterium]